jgi:hypothetical protein
VQFNVDFFRPEVGKMRDKSLRSIYNFLFS